MNTISTSSLDSEDITFKDFLLILTSITFSVTCFSCYMKYMLSTHPETTSQVIEPTRSSNFQEQL